MSFTSLVDNVLFFFSAARGAINDNIIVFTFKLLVSIKFQASLIAQLVKNPPAMQETPVQFLGWEDPLEEPSHGAFRHQLLCLWDGRLESGS